MDLGNNGCNFVRILMASFDLYKTHSDVADCVFDLDIRIGAFLCSVALWLKS